MKPIEFNDLERTLTRVLDKVAKNYRAATVLDLESAVIKQAYGKFQYYIQCAEREAATIAKVYREIYMLPSMLEGLVGREEEIMVDDEEDIEETSDERQA